MSDRIPRGNANSRIRYIIAKYQPLISSNNKKNKAFNVNEAMQLIKEQDDDRSPTEERNEGYATTLLCDDVLGSVIRREKLTTIIGSQATPYQNIRTRLINENLHIGNPVYWLTAGNGIAASLKCLLQD